MSNEPENLDGLTAEAMPLIRKSMKVVGQAAFAFAWLSAFYMTFVAMVHRTQGQKWWVVVALVALGIGADFWVGAGPVILRSSSKWGIKGWVFVGWATLAMALVFSYSNKVAYWVQLTNDSSSAAIAERVDTLATQRALVAANPHERLPEAVKAERDGVVAAIAGKQAEIDGLPATWPNRLRRAQRERQDLEMQRARLDSEYQTAAAVAAAQVKIDAAKTKEAIVAAKPNEEIDPVVQFIIDAAAIFGVIVTATGALVWLHAFYAFFHEMAQFTFLGLATLRIPIHKMEAEHTFLVSQRQIRARKKVGMVRAHTEEHALVHTAKAHHRASRKSIRQIAEAEASLETAKKMRTIERMRRAFEAEMEAEDGPQGPLPPELWLPSPNYEKTKTQPMVKQRQRMFDADSGEELIPINYPKFLKKRKIGDRTLAEAESAGSAEPPPPDETGVDALSGRFDGGIRPWASDLFEERAHDAIADADEPGRGGAAAVGAVPGGEVGDGDHLANDREPEQRDETVDMFEPEPDDAVAAADSLGASVVGDDPADGRFDKSDVPTEIPSSEFAALLKAGKIDQRGYEIALYDEAYGPADREPLPESHRLPAPEQEDA